MRNTLIGYVLLILCAASASAQTRSFTNADLGKPTPAARPKVDPAVLEGFRQRSESWPWGSGGFGGACWGCEAAAPAPSGPQGLQPAGLPIWGAYAPYGGWSGPVLLGPRLPVWSGSVNGVPTTVFRIGSGPRGSAPKGRRR